MGSTKKFIFFVVKNFSGGYGPRPRSKCKMVLDIYFGRFLGKSELRVFQKMAICIKRFWVIFGQFWLFRAHFGPRVSKMYLLQLFRCKENNEINKSGAISLFGKLDSPCAPKPTLGPKSPLKRPRRAKIGLNAPLVVQLIGFGPKKPNLSRSVLRCVPFTRNQPASGSSVSVKKNKSTSLNLTNAAARFTMISPGRALCWSICRESFLTLEWLSMI